MKNWAEQNVHSHIDKDMEPEHWVHSTCNLCSIGCGCEIAVADNRIVGIRGKKDHPINLGRLDIKARDQWIPNNSPDRLLKPLIRTESGDFKEINWDKAMETIVSKAKEVLKEKGPNGFSIYSTGQGFLEDYYTIAKVGRAGIGTHLLDANTRLCTATTEYCLIQSFGSDGAPAGFEDLDTAETVLFFGHNPAETGTVFFERVMERKRKTGRPFIITVDPRKTLTAQNSDLHLAIKPGTNLALLNGLISELLQNGCYDRDFIDSHTTNFAKVTEAAEEWTLEKASKMTGLSLPDLKKMAQILGQTPSLVTTTLQGVYHAADTTATCVAINNIHLMRGLIGKPGCGPLHMAGQPSSSANRTVGGVGTYPGNRNQNNPKHLKEMAGLWNVEQDRLEVGPELGIVKQIELIEQGQIGFFWNIHTNPLVSLPNRLRAKEALKKTFVVVQDPFMTETAREAADLILPTAMWGEKEGTMENADRTINLLRKAVEPPAGVKTDFQILLDFAERMGFKDKDGNPLIGYRTPEEAFEEWKIVSKGRPSDMTAMSYQKLEEKSGMHWPANEDYPEGAPRLYEDLWFRTDPDDAQSYGKDFLTGRPFSRKEFEAQSEPGKAIFYATPYMQPAEHPVKDYPFWLNTGRLVWHWHTRTKTARSAYLDEAAKEAYAEITEEDAERLNLIEGEIVKVSSPRGSVELPIMITDKGKSGTIFVPFHFGNWEDEPVPNDLTTDLVDSISHQPSFKSSVCHVEKMRKHYTAASGETLSSIAADHHLSAGALARLNRLDGNSAIENETVLEIPEKMKAVTVHSYNGLNE